ncbi:hypothetical protein C0033_00445 [Clostridium sp. chh4-2]|uniref:hypothetical protein n=1 Tax=Clostridium sp. chh4-2 TaxID=2067550 RepID=UPI000CCDF95A|nr:hypothetical protein [Clostridium sp. chh4-2]PNV63837.1 hypothetical protein C0033_00445 [Clostridium sp. chh4-2]
MIIPMTKTLETELLLSEEELTKKSKMKHEGAGLLILGIGVLAMGILNHLLLHILYESDIIWIAVTVCCVLLGIVLSGFGGKLINKIGASVAEMTAKDSDCSAEEILEFYRECRQSNALLLSLTSQPSKEKDSMKVGFLTKNWLRLPDHFYNGVMRISDVAVIWYEETALPGYDPGVFVVKSNGKMLYVKCKSDIGTEFVEAVTGRNTKCINARCFLFEDNDYNAFQNPQMAANIYKSQWH